MPLDRELILKSVRKTGRAMTVDPAHQTCSAASEISAMIVENAFDALRGPVLRVATADTQLPFSPAIEKALYPSVDRIVAAAYRLVGAEHRNSRPKDSGHASYRSSVWECRMGRSPTG